MIEFNSMDNQPTLSGDYLISVKVCWKPELDAEGSWYYVVFGRHIYDEKFDNHIWRWCKNIYKWRGNHANTDQQDRLVDTTDDYIYEPDDFYIEQITGWCKIPEPLRID